MHTFPIHTYKMGGVNAKASQWDAAALLIPSLKKQCIVSKQLRVAQAHTAGKKDPPFRWTGT